MKKWKQLLASVFFLGFAGLYHVALGAELPVASSDNYELRVYWGGPFNRPQKPQLTIPVQVGVPFSATNSETFHKNPIAKVLRIEDPIYATTYYHGSGLLHAPKNGKFKLEHTVSMGESAKGHEGNSGMNCTFELELDKPKFRFWSGGLVQGYRVVLSKQPRPILFAAELPPGAQVKREVPSWGKEVDGLQLGIDLVSLNRPYAIGGVAGFTLSVRNNTTKPIKFKREFQHWCIPPHVADESSKPLPFAQYSGLQGPAYNIQGGLITIVVEAKKTVEIANAYLTIGPAKENESNPWLDAEPGKYRVTYSYNFATFWPEDEEEVGQEGIRKWSGNLTSGEVLLEVVSQPK